VYCQILTAHIYTVPEDGSHDRGHRVLQLVLPRLPTVRQEEHGNHIINPPTKDTKNTEIIYFLPSYGVKLFATAGIFLTLTFTRLAREF